MNKISEKFLTKEIILYALFGVFTSVVNVVVFYILYKLNIDYKISNIIALVITKIIAYLCNKYFVFKSKCANFLELLKEFIGFMISRLLTLLLDYFGLILLVSVFHIEMLISKIIVTTIVVILNYIIGKNYIFNRSNYEKNN